MTDKQIIMDSSKCKHYWNGNCSDWDNTLIGACDDFENCYCKMYLRKEQEFEELKEELQKYKDNEQQEKEIQKLYNKFEGNSLIEKSSPYEN